MREMILQPRTLVAAIAGGVAMGALHVVTGADHLSAVATLACGNSRTRAFWLGVRWGGGHSVGQGRTLVTSRSSLPSPRLRLFTLFHHTNCTLRCPTFLVVFRLSTISFVHDKQFFHFITPLPLARSPANHLALHTTEEMHESEREREKKRETRNARECVPSATGSSSCFCWC